MCLGAVDYRAPVSTTKRLRKQASSSATQQMLTERASEIEAEDATTGQLILFGAPAHLARVGLIGRDSASARNTFSSTNDLMQIFEKQFTDVFTRNQRTLRQG